MPDKLRSQQHQARLLHEVNKRHYEMASFGEKAADAIVGVMGSWRFIIVQTILVSLWIIYNGYVAVRFLRGHGFDAPPWVLLNLAFSIEAAYSAPAILLATNRSSVRDRLTLEHAAHESEEDRKETEGLRTELSETRKELRELRQLTQDQTRLLQTIVAAIGKGRGRI